MNATDGAAYCLGAVNRDCWYLYTLNPSNASGAGYPLNALLGADSSDDGFEVGSDGTEDCCSDGSCDGVEDVEEEELDDVSDESSDDSLESALTTDCALSEQVPHSPTIQFHTVGTPSSAVATLNLSK